MNALYNEFEPFAAAWLRELIKAGVIADGEVSEADMWDVVPTELMGFKQVHLCAGIGGWSAALRLAGWPDDRPVWTVSLPCQPFSAAGKGGGLADERGQLADALFWLAGICRPVCIFGEQVEAAIKHDWLDVMASQLERIGYTVGAVGFPASSVGAFHLRQRLYWVAESSAQRAGRVARTMGRAQQASERCKPKFRGTAEDVEYSCPTRRMADAEHSERRPQSDRRNDFDSEEAGRQQGASVLGECGSTGIVGYSGEQGLEVRGRECKDSGTSEAAYTAIKLSRVASNFWSDAEWIPCRDGKARPTKPGLFPLAHGVRNRVGTLRGAGNAIVPQAAAEFIRAFM